MSYSRIKETGFRFYTSIVLDAFHICAARTDAGAEQSGVRSASGGTGDVSRAGGLLFHAVRRRTRRNVCLRLQTAQKRRPPHRQPRTASYLRAPHNLLPAEQKSGCRRMRGGSGIVRFSRSGNAGVCSASACSAACRSPMRRPLRESRTHRRFFRPSAQRRVPAPPHMECRCAAAFPRSRRARTQLALMCGKMQHRLPPLCTEASDCEAEASEPIPPKPFARFGATYRETARQKAAKRFSLRTKKTSAARSRRRLSFTRFSSRRGRTEG